MVRALGFLPEDVDGCTRRAPWAHTGFCAVSHGGALPPEWGAPECPEPHLRPTLLLAEKTTRMDGEGQTASGT